MKLKGDTAPGGHEVSYIYRQFCIIPGLFTFVAECRGRVVNAPTAYSGDPKFDSRPWRPAILIELFVFFLSPSK
jgi:hypothetical protein